MCSYVAQLKEELLVTDRLPDDDVIFSALKGICKIKDALLSGATLV